MVFGLKKYRQHLLGRPIIVRTDHAALKYLLTTPEPVGQQGRWLDLLSVYDITIQHRPGRVHGNSDALSRRPCERSSETDCQPCRRATPALAAATVSCEALPAESSDALPAPLRFLPLHSQADASSDSSITFAPTDIASDHLEVPASPVQECEANPASSAPIVKTWSQLFGVPATPDLDDNCEARSLNDNLLFPSETEKPPLDLTIMIGTCTGMNFTHLNLSSLARLPCTIRNTDNAKLQQDITKENGIKFILQQQQQQPFYGSVEFVRENPGEPVPE